MQNNTVASLSTLQYHYLHTLMEGRREVSEREAELRRDNLQLDRLCPPYAVAVVSPYYNSVPPLKKDEQIEECANCVWHQIAKAGHRCYCLPDSYDNIRILFAGADPGQPEELESIARDVRNRLRQTTGLDCFIGIGTIVDRLTEISTSAHLAGEMLAYKYMYADEGVVNVQNVVRFSHSPNYSSDIRFDRVIGCFQEGDFGKMAQRLEELVEDIRHRRNVSRIAIKRSFIELTVTILHIASNANVDTEEILNGFDFYKWIMAQCHTEVMTAWLMDLSQKLHVEMKRQLDTEERDIIRMACQYIGEHLSDPGTGLTDVSTHAGLSPAYFSQLFKKEKGIGLNNYITASRIDKARELLLTSDMKIADIALQTGFTSLSYFSRTFRRSVGKTPGEFRKTERGKTGGQP